MGATRFVAWIRRPTILTPALFVAFAGILLLRSGATLLVPGVWNEEGLFIVPSLLRNGPVAILEPVNGYLVLVPRLVEFVAVTVSATQMPLIATALAWLVTIAIGIAIATSPTMLAHRIPAALAVFLIPTGPEVFGTALYLLWWSALPLFLVALWRPDSPRVTARLIFVVLGGLSSPVVVIVAPVLWVRAIALRTPREIIVAATATLVAGIQGSVLMTSASVGRIAEFPDVSSIVPRFLGEYLVGWWTGNNAILWAAGLGFLVMAIAGLVRLRQHRTALIVLGYLTFASIALSISRSGSIAIDPDQNGARYFFFPFVLMAWVLLQLITVWSPRWLVLAPIGALVAATVGVGTVWNRTNQDLNWAAHLETCRYYTTYGIPVHFAGDRHDAWWTTLTGAECRAWLDRDPFRQPANATWPYRFTSFRENDTELATPVAVILGGAEPMDAGTLPIEGVVGWRLVTASDRITLRLHRGDSILLRTSNDTADVSVMLEPGSEGFRDDLRPTSSWRVVTFDHAGLPGTFEVTIRLDADHAQWIELAVAEPTSD